MTSSMLYLLATTCDILPLYQFLEEVDEISKGKDGEYQHTEFLCALMSQQEALW